MIRASSGTLRERTRSRLSASAPPSLPCRPGQPSPARVAYYGVRTEHGAVVMKRSGERAELLSLRRDVDTTSWAFEWGYFGQGPLQLAVALLADAIGPEAARRFAWGFCVLVTAELPRESGWSFTLAEVRARARAAGWRG